MKTSHPFWKTILPYIVFVLAIFANACDDSESYPAVGGEEIVVKDDKIQSPGWLVQVVDSVATGRVGAYDGFIPWVYLVEIRGENYVIVWDHASSSLENGNLIYTLSGERVLYSKENDLFWVICNSPDKYRIAPEP